MTCKRSAQQRRNSKNASNAQTRMHETRDQTSCDSDQAPRMNPFDKHFISLAFAEHLKYLTTRIHFLHLRFFIILGDQKCEW